jgi:threonine dehydrogenase-like Zn-dependent dehydrogenase
VTEFSPGDRIFMRRAHGSHQVLPADQCSPVPQGIDLKMACWCGLAKTAFRAAWAGRFNLGGHVLIIGAGPVGQMVIRWAATAGVETVAVVDLSTLRLEHATQGGATRTLCGDVVRHFEQIQKIDQGKGPSLVIDTTGNSVVFQHALSAGETITGLIYATALVYPDKKIASIKYKSVRKRMKEKAFAASVNRDIILECEEIGIPLDEFIQLSVDAMREVAEEIGL